MSATDRENRLLIAENWTKIYQSFRNADFQSYDFENLRRTMINYLRQNYPEDFNDYLDSSEYLALIDLIAFLGQNIAFRVDLNARENFLELAERRESILRLARTVSYNAKRNLPATGLLKITSIQSSESIVDSNGRNLAGQTILWNDVSNQNWYDQFIRVINSSFSKNQQFGNPIANSVIYGIPTQQYRFDASNTDVPVYSFTKIISGLSMNFEITSTTFTGKSYIYEEAPKVGNSIACVYRDDGHGAGGLNSGFFFNFTQGSLNTGLFTISHPTSNESIDINTPYINNSDVWLYELDNSGIEYKSWTKLDELVGNNVIYNSLNKNIKDLFTVSTKANDTISLIFGDGTYGNMPQGTYRTYYRISNGLSYTINPNDMRNVTISIPYISENGVNETITLTMGLTSSVNNSSPSETNNSIKANAPQNFYTQNRMISGEDYNIVPLVSNQQVLKIKAINRTSSGISRYFDLADPSSKYSSTTMFADDGVIYAEKNVGVNSFTYLNKSDISGIINNTVLGILSSTALRNFFYTNFIVESAFENSSTIWSQQSISSIDSSGTISNISSAISSYFKVGALLKFEAPIGYYFDTSDNNTLKAGYATVIGSSYYIWGEIVRVSSGANLQVFTLNKPIPDNTRIISVIPKYTTIFSDAMILELIELIYTKTFFALRYDELLSVWTIVLANDINLTSPFNLSHQGDLTGTNLDASWLILFTPKNSGYMISTRGINYIFESDKQLRFYFDGTRKIYDTNTSTTIADKITVLNNNVNNRGLSATVIGVVDTNILSVLNIVGIYGGMKIQGNGIPNDAFVTSVNVSTNTITIDKKLTTNVQTTAFFNNIGNMSYTNDMQLNITSAYVGVDGYIDTKKVIVSFLESNNGVVDDPDVYSNIISSANLLDDYIIEKKYNISSSHDDYRYDNTANVKILSSEPDVGDKTTYPAGQYFYFVDKDVVKQLIKETAQLTPSLDYKVYNGRGGLKFQYTHAADSLSRIDPGVSNIIDIYVLLQSYDIAYRRWVKNTSSTEPLPPSSFELYNTLAPSLNLVKATSDEIIFHAVQYTVLFGKSAIPELQATFKVIKNQEQVVSDNDIQARVIDSINQFFAIENWNFGDTFYFSELSAYVVKSLTPYIVSFLIVPKQSGKYFGSLFEIVADSNQLFISSATVEDVEIISGITANGIKSADGAQFVTNAQQVITSSPYGRLNV